MRMPQPDIGHYKNDILNYGHIYTNLEDIEIQEDIAKDYITVYKSIREKDYKPINLLSCHSERHREKTRLSPLFIEIFLKEAKKYDLKKKVDIKSRNVDARIIADQKKEDVDSLVKATIVGDKSIRQSGSDLQKTFDFFVRQSLSPLYPEDRSVGRIKTSIYTFFEQKFKIKCEEAQDDIIGIALSSKNKQHFVNVIDSAKQEYIKETAKRKPLLIPDEIWNVPEYLQFGSDDIKEDRKKSIVQPFYVKYLSKIEKVFVDFLEKPNGIVWWFKNEDRDATFFAVPYDNGWQKPFYVDFIIQMKDGRIGLFDTKAGLTLKTAGPKVEGLYQYIQSENKKGKKLFGGIVTNADPKDYKGRWVYFEGQDRDLKDNGFNNWKTLEL